MQYAWWKRAMWLAMLYMLTFCCVSCNAMDATAAVTGPTHSGERPAVLSVQPVNLPLMFELVCT
jgi:hypothetical protein